MPPYGGARVTTLVRVADLLGKDVAGFRADMRSRTADGELMYEHTAAEGPRMVTMTRVYLRTEPLGPTLQKVYGKPKGEWLRWEWERDHTRGSFDCGFSGVLAEDEKHKDYHIIITEGE